MLNNRVMARTDVLAAECRGFAPETAELQFLIAHHARVRRPARLVFAGEIVNHYPLELIGLVHHVMRNAERMRYAAGIGDRLRSAALILRSQDTILRAVLHLVAVNVITLLTLLKYFDNLFNSSVL